MGTAQQDANAIGSAIRELEAEIATVGNASLTEKAAALHQMLSQGLVDHLPHVDWHEAAGLTGQQASARAGDADGVPTTNAGGKHEPTPTGG